MNRFAQNEMKNQLENSLCECLYLILYIVPDLVWNGWVCKSSKRKPNPGGPETSYSVKGGVNFAADPTRSTIISYVECIGWGQQQNLLQTSDSIWPPRIGMDKYLKPNPDTNRGKNLLPQWRETRL